MTFSLFAMPSATDIMASTSEYAAPIVNDFMPLIYFTIAICSFVAFVVVITMGLAK